MTDLEVAMDKVFAEDLDQVDVLHCGAPMLVTFTFTVRDPGSSVIPMADETTTLRACEHCGTKLTTAYVAPVTVSP